MSFQILDLQEEDSLDQFPTEEMQPIDESMIPKMKPLPDEQNFGKEMALSVALEMEEKRRNTKEATEDGSKEDQVDDEEDDNIVYSLDEITHMKSQEDKNLQGPAVDHQELIKQKAAEEGKKLLEAYWKFVDDNQHDFNGWTYLLQHVENINVLGTYGFT